MRNISRIFIGCFLFVWGCVSFLNAQQQDWVEMMHEKDANFFTIQKLFKEAFEGVENKKGTGWKQFKRWEYYYRNRVDEQGNFPPPGHVLNEMENYYRGHPIKSYSSGTGTWKPLGPTFSPPRTISKSKGLGRLNCIAFHPTDTNTIYVGAPSGGLWVSTEGGTGWRQQVTGLARLGVSTIVVHPANPNIIYIGTGDRDGGDAPGYGVWRSTDGGLTWAAHNNGMGNRTVYEILMDPANPNYLIASTNGSRVYRSTDGGANWSFTTTSSPMKDLAFKPGDPSTIYASGTTFDVSTDGGMSFTQITDGVPVNVLRMAIAVSEDEPSYVYLLAGNQNSLDSVVRSTNSGNSFTLRARGPNILGRDVIGGQGAQAWYDLVLIADPNNADILYSGGINIWKSMDGGLTWSIITHWTRDNWLPALHADQHALEFSPHDGKLYAGNDGGIYVSDDGGDSWTMISDGLNIGQVYKLSVAQNVDHKVMNGYQDNGTAIYENGSWDKVIGGDGMECIIDPTDHKYMYGSLYYGNIRRRGDGDNRFFTIAKEGVNGIDEKGPWVTPYALDPNYTYKMYAGYENIWRSDDVKFSAPNAVSWTKITNWFTRHKMVDIAVAPSNSDVVYAARDKFGEQLFKSTNASSAAPSWTNLQAGLSSAAIIKDIAIDPANSDHVFIAQGNDIYESIDGGASFIDFSGTLPNISVNTIVLDPNSPVKAMYVGMDVGVYYRDSTMNDWQMFATGLTNVEITELEIYSNSADCSNKLYASTYGQGLWVSDLKDPGGIAPNVCFDASTRSTCPRIPITLRCKSEYTPTSWTWTITPATYSFVNNTHANSMNPQIAFLAPGSYTISLQVANAFGVDSITKTNHIYVLSSSNAQNFNDNFELYGICGMDAECGGSCPVYGSWNNKVNGIDDDIDWLIGEGSTPSTNTGPSVDFIPGTSIGNYAFLETTGNCSAATAILESGCIHLDTNYYMTLSYHMKGAMTGELHIDIFTNGVWNEDLVPPVIGDQGDNWYTKVVDLSSYTGRTIGLRIRGVAGAGFLSDMAIDGIRFNTKNFLITKVVDFQATCENSGRVVLDWEITGNNFEESMEIQKYSTETQTWETIGQEAVTRQKNFQFVDENFLVGDNRYRIVFLNQDGLKKYSEEVMAVCDFDINGIHVYPNPFTNTTTLQLYSEQEWTMSYRLTNLLGQEIYRSSLNVQKGVNTWELPFEDLPQGVYLLDLSNLKQTTFKIIKL